MTTTFTNKQKKIIKSRAIEISENKKKLKLHIEKMSSEQWLDYCNKKYNFKIDWTDFEIRENIVMIKVMVKQQGRFFGFVRDYIKIDIADILRENKLKQLI